MSIYSITVSPNPATARVHVNGPKFQTVVLGHTNGDVLQQVKLDKQGHAELDLSELPGGVYLVRSGRSTRMLVKD